MPKTARGLSWERTTERIREFVAGLKGETPRRAVICTYDFDAERFEATVLPALTRRGRQFRTLVLSDAGALQEELAKVRGGRLGRYELAPVRCVGRGVFHPKLIYLAAGRRHLIGIGSSNLTQGGLGGNLELMLFTSDDGPNARSLADGATAFLSQLLLTTGIAIPQSARNFIENCVIGGVRNANSESVLHSLSNPLLYQMQMVHRTIAGVGPAKAVTVLSPWHSATASPDGTEPEMIARLAKSFNLRELSVYTNGTNRRGPSLGDAKVHIRDGRENGEATARTKNGTEDHALGDEQRMPTRVHAKAYLIEGDRATSFFFGSANCTKPALVQSAATGGNVELLVPLQLNPPAVAKLKADLKLLFSKAEGTFNDVPRRAPTALAGKILSGAVVTNGQETKLRLEAPGVSQAVVKVAGRRDGTRAVDVTLRKDGGEVSEKESLKMLFDGGAPSRDAREWGCVLWERRKEDWVPFPVCVPHLCSEHVTAEDALLEWAREELGFWPPLPRDDRNSEASDDERPDQTNDDVPDDKWLAALDQADHQGRLDKVGVATAAWHRGIMRLTDLDQRNERLLLIRKRINRLELEPYLRTVVLEQFRATTENQRHSPRKPRKRSRRASTVITNEVAPKLASRSARGRK